MGLTNQAKNTTSLPLQLEHLQLIFSEKDSCPAVSILGTIPPLRQPDAFSTFSLPKIAPNGCPQTGQDFVPAAWSPELGPPLVTQLVTQL